MAKRDVTISLLEQLQQHLEPVNISLRTFFGLFSPVTPREVTLRAYLARAVHWIATLSRFDSAAHYQGYASAHRGLIEIGVDVLIVHGEPGDANAEKIEAWEFSSDAKATTLLLDYFAKAGDSGFPPQVISAIRSRSIAPESASGRVKYWNGKHPKRWTGHSSLLADMEELDPRRCKTCAPEPLQLLYHAEFRLLCWDVHGSTFAGHRFSSPEERTNKCAGSVAQSLKLVLMVCRVLTHECQDKLKVEDIPTLDALVVTINDVLEILVGV